VFLLPAPGQWLLYEATATRPRKHGCALDLRAVAYGAGEFVREDFGAIPIFCSLTLVWRFSLMAASGTAVPTAATFPGRTGHSGRPKSSETGSGIGGQRRDSKPTTFGSSGFGNTS